MIFITGGAFGGKSEFAAKKYSLAAQDCRSGLTCPLGSAYGGRALFGLEELISRELDAGLDPAAELKCGLSQNPGIIITCAETGCGVVPADARLRALREAVGRAGIFAAERADEVYRVCCGIAMKIK
jgi:adenosylcobinamide kinase/adenosylcobinamide-phosphate guanylyltransferase